VRAQRIVCPIGLSCAAPAVTAVMLAGVGSATWQRLSHCHCDDKGSDRAPRVEQITTPGERGHMTVMRRGRHVHPPPADLTGVLRKLAAKPQVASI
jgi:hypothetical protein